MGLAPERFNIDAAELDRLQAAGGLIGVFANTVVVGKVSKALSPRHSLGVAAGTLAACFIVYSLLPASTSIAAIYALLVPLTVAGSMLYTLCTARISKSGASNPGVAIGLAHSARSLSGIVGPTLGGKIYEFANFEGVGRGAALLATMACLVAMRRNAFAN